MGPLMRLATTVAGLAAASVVVAVVALAHGGDTSKVHGCVAKDTKYVRILGAPGLGSATDSCKANESAVDWGQTGPQGTQGPPGPQGPGGPEGLQGPPGPGGALAYALISFADGVDDERFDGVDERTSNGLTDEMVSHPSGGVYCFYLPFSSRAMIATPADANGAVYASAYELWPGAPSDANITDECDGENALVVIRSGDGGQSNRQFYVVFF